MTSIKRIALLGLILLFGLVLQGLVFNHVSDDAFISFRYAHNFAEGAGLVFNHGEKVEGYSNLLWILVLTLMEKLGMSRGDYGLLFPVKTISIILGLLAITLSYRLGQIICRQQSVSGDYAPLVLPALLASALPFHFWSVSGLETPLFVLLFVLFLISSSQTFFNEGKKIAPALLLFFLSLVRPEAPILILPVILILVQKKELKFSRLSPFLYFFIIPYAILILLRVFYYQAVLPNIFYTKTTGGLAQLIDGMKYYVVGIKNINPLICALALIPLILLRLEGINLLLIANGLVYAIFILLVGGDFMVMSRFFVHMMPVIFGMAMLGFFTISDFEWLKSKYRNSLVGKIILGAIAALVFVAPPLINYYKDLAKYGKQWTVSIAEFSRPYDEVIRYVNSSHQADTLWFDRSQVQSREQNREPSKDKELLVAVEQLGYYGYFTKWRILDLQGLVDLRISRAQGKLHRKYDIDYVMERKPNFIVTNSGGPGAAIESNIYNLKFAENAFFRENYFLAFKNDWFVVFKLASASNSKKFNE